MSSALAASSRRPRPALSRSGSSSRRSPPRTPLPSSSRLQPRPQAAAATVLAGSPSAAEAMTAALYEWNAVAKEASIASPPKIEVTCRIAFRVHATEDSHCVLLHIHCARTRATLSPSRSPSNPQRSCSHCCVAHPHSPLLLARPRQAPPAPPDLNKTGAGRPQMVRRKFTPAPVDWLGFSLPYRRLLDGSNSFGEGTGIPARWRHLATAVAALRTSTHTAQALAPSPPAVRSPSSTRLLSVQLYLRRPLHR